MAATPWKPAGPCEYQNITYHVPRRVKNGFGCKTERPHGKLLSHCTGKTLHQSFWCCPMRPTYASRSRLFSRWNHLIFILLCGKEDAALPGVGLSRVAFVAQLPLPRIFLFNFISTSVATQQKPDGLTVCMQLKCPSSVMCVLRSPEWWRRSALHFALQPLDAAPPSMPPCWRVR